MIQNSKNNSRRILGTATHTPAPSCASTHSCPTTNTSGMAAIVVPMVVFIVLLITIGVCVVIRRRRLDRIRVVALKRQLELEEHYRDQMEQHQASQFVVDQSFIDNSMVCPMPQQYPSYANSLVPQPIGYNPEYSYNNAANPYNPNVANPYNRIQQNQVMPAYAGDCYPNANRHDKVQKEKSGLCEKIKSLGEKIKSIGECLEILKCLTCQ